MGGFGKKGKQKRAKGKSKKMQEVNVFVHITVQVESC